MFAERRTIAHLTASAVIAVAMAIGFVVVGGLSPTQAKGGHGQGNASGNHGSIVSSVARSTCTATNPHNPSVSNHGMCVSSVAKSQHTSSVASAGTKGTSTTGGKGKSGKKHGKKGSKTHKSKKSKNHSKTQHGKQ